ncbi:FGP1 [Ecytonucleospora hepatopenaei]|uniref:FGP1 n=1 Tax=Ecytonucleospora hepatopenaei TaxID=646526 RepID=A0A1W0E8D6_9MICR|nr:FGP1 [Ecytonucleospora hepatopenaei]
MDNFISGCIHTIEECKTVIALVQAKKWPRITGRGDVCTSVIGSGQIYVYSENESQIKRWTDKRKWTPSRVYGCFLMYREMNGNLCKKAFSENTENGKYHIVAYSTKEEERCKTCCIKNQDFKVNCNKFTTGLLCDFSFGNTNIQLEEPKYRQNRRKHYIPNNYGKKELKDFRDINEILNYCCPDGPSKKEEDHLKNTFAFENKQKNKDLNKQNGYPFDLSNEKSVFENKYERKSNEQNSFDYLSQLIYPKNENLCPEDINWQKKLTEEKMLFEDEGKENSKERKTVNSSTSGMSDTVPLNDNCLNENKKK